MADVQHLLSSHGIWVLLGLVFAGGLGLPVPSSPILIAAGVLAGVGQLPLAGVVLGSSIVLLGADMLWFELGRWRGRRLLAFLCKISLEPDTCVRRTEALFARSRATSLVISKFLPGLRTVAPPLAGMLAMGRGEFVLFNGAGTLLWVGALTALGYLFSEQVAKTAAPAAQLGGWLAFAVGVAFVTWVAWKYLERKRVLGRLRIAGITPEELNAQLESGGVVVIDLRPTFALQPDAPKVLGALQMSPEELERRYGEIPRDRDVVLYCDCPNEASAAQMARRLRKRGVKRVRPLLGGIDAWRAHGYPVESIQAAA
jgi:membrane protein DedA with SNARE-associated domain/rhodanese-related sulfurtransferase